MAQLEAPVDGDVKTWLAGRNVSFDEPTRALLVEIVVLAFSTSTDYCTANEIMKKLNPRRSKESKLKKTNINQICYKKELFDHTADEDNREFRPKEELWNLIVNVLKLTESNGDIVRTPTKQVVLIRDPASRASSAAPTPEQQQQQQRSPSITPPGQSRQRNNLISNLTATFLDMDLTSNFRHRVALVLSNQDYKEPDYKLDYAKSDADRMSDHLRNNLNFEVFDRHNLTQQQMKNTIANDWFGQAFPDPSPVTEPTLFFIYYAGHASYVMNEYYLWPIDCSSSYKQVMTKGITLMDFCRAVHGKVDPKARGRSACVFVFDACRDRNPTKNDPLLEKADHTPRTGDIQWEISQYQYYAVPNQSVTADGAEMGLTNCLLQAMKPGRTPAQVFDNLLMMVQQNPSTIKRPTFMANGAFSFTF